MSCLLSACVGAINDEDGVVKPPEPDPPGATARQLFDKNIYPAMHDKCGGSSCHAQSNMANGAFVADMASAGYDLAVNEAKLVAAFNPQAPILQRIANGHYASWTPNDVGAITKWLAQEVTERGEQKDLLREFAGCMNIDDFNVAKMPEAWANEEADNAGTCITCHVNGGNDLYVSDDGPKFFNAITQDRTRLSKYFAVDAGKTQVVVNEELFKIVGTPMAPHATHAPWNYTDGANMEALRSFYGLVRARATAGNCPPPRF